MAIVLGGHQYKHPPEDKKIDGQAHGEWDSYRHVHRVFFERIEEAAGEGEGDERGHKEVGDEHVSFIMRFETVVKRVDYVPGFFYKPTYHDGQEVDYWECVDDVIQGVDRPYAHEPP